MTDPGPLSPIQQQAVQTQVRVDRGRKLLRSVAIAAAVVWLIAVLSVAISTWHVLDDQNSPAVNIPNLVEQNPHFDGWSMLTVVETSVQATWGYALVAVGAFAASLWFDDSQARDLFELLDDSDDADADGPGDGA